MAYSFNGLIQYLSSSSPINITNNLTISAWFYTTGGQNSHRGIVSLYSTGSDLSRCALKLASDNKLDAQMVGGGGATKTISSSTINLNTWYSAIGVFSGRLTVPTVYLNGTIGNTIRVNSGIVNFTNSNSQIGMGLERLNSNWYNGYVAEVGVWSVNNLTTDEIISLSKGVCPAKIRPQSLVFYAPLVRNLSDFKNNLAITNNNSATEANHPRIYY